MASSAGEVLTVARARALLAAGLAALEERKQEVNDLNVYPVPDGDTGTNLALTMRGILDSLSRVPPGLKESDLCAVIAQAALMGARGNSGVILSQIIRGAMEVLGQAGPVTNEVLARCFSHATETAYRAVRKPVEGTILTVLREMTQAAVEAAEGVEPAVFIEHVISEGWKSVERTPSLLQVLADAGVVDAGGYGLVILIEGAASGRCDWEAPIVTHRESRPVSDAALYAERPEEQSRLGYCTSFLLSGQDMDQRLLEEKLNGLGDSLLVVGDHGHLKIHVHTNDPGRVLSLGTSMGVLSEIEIDNMAEQTAARARRLGAIANVAGGSDAADVPVNTSSGDPGLTQVVAVVAGEGNKRLFRNLGVDLIVDGGQSMNPSAEDLMRAINEATAPWIIVLPNNSNVIMTAEQTARLTDRNVLVVPSKSMQAGLTAAVAYEKRASGSENARDMRTALEGVVTGEVTQAVRDSLVDGVQVKAQDYIGLVEGRVVVSSPDVESVVYDVVGRLLEGGRGMLTALLGEGSERAQTTAALDRVRAMHPGVEVDVHEGGQPFYPLLLSAE